MARSTSAWPSVDQARAQGVSQDGTKVFVTGSSYRSTTSFDYATAAYDSATGTLLWTKRYNGPSNSEDQATALTVSPDGSTVFVTGYSYNSTSDDNDYATASYDAATGAQLWTRRYNRPNPPGNVGDDATALAVSPDGSLLFVTGKSFGPTSSYDYATVAYESDTGATRWLKRYNGSASGEDYAYAIGVSPDASTVFVTGYSYGSTGGYDYAIVAYDAETGDPSWARRYNGPTDGHDYAFALGVSPDGSKVFVTGYSEVSSIHHYYATIAFDASSGTRLWAAPYHGPGNYDEAFSLGVSPDGSAVFVTGYSAGPGEESGYDYATVAYDAAAGAELWAQRFDASIYDAATAIGVSPDASTVYVTGQSTGMSGNDDYATVAYDAPTGSQLWVARYEGPANLGGGQPLALGVSPDGSKVFVAGTSPGSTGGSDYATVAYSTD